MSRRYLLIVFIALFMLAGCLNAQIVLQGVVTDNGAEPVENAFIEVIDQANADRCFNGITDAQGQYSITITETGIDETPAQKPGAFQLLQNYPNPFNPSTVISYEIPHPAQVRIEIYNVLGQKIKTLLDAWQTDLYGHILWNGINDQGRGVSAGVYLYTMITEGKRITRKMLLLDGHLGNISASSSAAGAGQSGLYKAQSNNYLLRVSSKDIETWEQHDVQIMGNKVFNINVIRTVTDIDGNVYRTVKIGEQWWMAENLQVTHYRNGDALPNITDDTGWSSLTTGALCAAADEQNNVATYGYLYNWFAVNDNRNLAPLDWHLPTDEEWKQLEISLGMNRQEADDQYWRGTTQGGKLKETGTTHWEAPNAGATNETGFTVLPGGSRYFYGAFDPLGILASFWSASDYSDSFAWSRILLSDSVKVYRGLFEKQKGFSVRCILNGSLPNLPALSSPANGDTGITVLPMLTWIATGGAKTYGLQVSTQPDFSTLIIDEEGITTTSFQVNGLSGGVTYYWRVNATNNGATTAWTDPWSFTTISFITGTVTDIDGNVYKTIMIGEQWWMAENLKVTHYRNGDVIPNITNNGEWTSLTTGAWCCYYNDVNNISTYSCLYNWLAVHDGRQIAPSGWHVPSDEEWKQLEMTIGMSREQADLTDLRGSNEGGKLKETGTVHWEFPNEGATNEYGFTALPAGYRYDYGDYSNLGSGTIIWTATESSGTNAWNRLMDFGTPIIYRYDNNKKFGFSIRCVKD
ncbi:MAG TPA: FISUMP domain-containing protein [bacterium]|nr:FISUMP domain-containing protein [bacterium]HPN44243.1 FISUMP domain-containing protein [bacterium]